MKKDLHGMTLKEYYDLFQDLAEKKYRAKQLFQWVFQKAITDFQKMTNLPQELTLKLQQEVDFSGLKIKKKLISRLDDTTKFLLSLPDGETIETVRMSYTGKESRDRHTVCVSTQVGCPIGCPFCATGLSGWVRNLTTGEIVGQVLEMQKDVQRNFPGKKVTNVVFMGMGEPLLNYDNVLKAINIINDPLGINIGMRRITISTSGLVPQINALAKEKLPIVLAISLHAANNNLRNELVPINKKYPLDELLSACRDYISSTGRRITFEYALIAGKNDQAKDALELRNLLKGMQANVNLIPLNTVGETKLRRSQNKIVKIFAQKLQESGLEVAIREEKGSDIDAACGQLRRRRVE
ncbi:23S rRNA (adenine(2503)-C(2))-methyltransferase RlmN [Bacillota bacterium LX-D]|nr:23S rRNA (adenine(2503)-C(2))-methyltransferase RlmN [Bacillota bacterium LX-D]